MLTKINLPIGPFSFTINTDHQMVVDNLGTLYSDYPRVTQHDFIDFDITITTRSTLRRYVKPQVDFFLDEFAPFKPLPKDHAFAMLEWGMNWCIATKAHHFLLLHAGTIEKNGHVIVMPAAPGSGKSTLTAALVYNGWRLFSDELALISLKDERIYPCTRPINLKNDSIDIIKNYVEQATFSSIAKDTHKGTVSLLKPPKESVDRVAESGRLHSFVFPKYVANSEAKLTPIDKFSAFQIIIDQSFNYHILGVEAFNLISKLLNQVQCYQFEYSNFEDAKSVFSQLVNS
ncbi:HprK-related kinase A [Colwelliaceae bacterium 6471]